MWQRLSERARKAVYDAQEEAVQWGDSRVSAEHLLLGLLHDYCNVASTILINLGVDIAQLRSATEQHLLRKAPSTSPDMTLTPRGKQVIDLAYDESRNLGNNYIGTEHFLLGLIREGDGWGARELAVLGIELEAARREVIRLQAGEVPRND